MRRLLIVALFFFQYYLQEVINGAPNPACKIDLLDSNGVDHETTLNSNDFDSPDITDLKDICGDLQKNLEESSGFFEGDIKGVSRTPQSARANGLLFHNALIDSRLYWPNGVVPYTLSSVYPSSSRKIIANAIADFSQNTCIQLVPRSNEADYIHIQSVAGDGCSSYVGKIGGRQTISLQFPGCVTKGIAIHELMHAIGFQHEQSRTDRDDYVKIIWDNIDKDNWDNFQKYSKDVITDLGTAYDYKSVMHYSETAFSINGQVTIQTLRAGGNHIGQRKELSNNDAIKINKLYCGSQEIQMVKRVRGATLCTDPDKRWDYCFSNCVCVEWDRCTYHGMDNCLSKTAYSGTKSVTNTGKTCQRWDSQTPHHHDRLQYFTSDDLGDHNYCRNPDGSESPWCYTTDANKRWEFCFPSCGCVKENDRCALSGTVTCYSKTAYSGTKTTTVSGRTCQHWDTQTPHRHTRLQLLAYGDHGKHNYCRNPDGEAGPWCYTTDADMRWEYCFPTCVCVKEDVGCALYDSDACYSKTAYTGMKNTTVSGKSCQRWDSQTPHSHDRQQHLSVGDKGNHNYCRNPDGEPSPWCYTTDSGKRWEYCFTDCE